MKYQAYRGTGKTINKRAQTKICERKRKRNSERNTGERKEFMKNNDRVGENMRKKYYR